MHGICYHWLVPCGLDLPRNKSVRFKSYRNFKAIDYDRFSENFLDIDRQLYYINDDISFKTFFFDSSCRKCFWFSCSADKK